MQKAVDAQIERRIVLIGGGHAHVGVLRSFAMKPEPGVDIVLIAKELDAPYSGMLPGFVAGHYTLDECHIDLVRLAHFAGARLIHGEADGVDTTAKVVAIAGRPPLRYDFASIDTGITPDIDDIEGARDHAIAVKPVSSFAPRWQALEAQALKTDGPRRITVVGTGAAGFELILAIRHRLRERAPASAIAPDSFSFALVGSGGLLRTHTARARRMAAKALADAGVLLIEDDAATAIGPDHLRLASGLRLASDATLLTTKAAAPAWFKASALPLDERGFLAVRPTLQLTGDDDVFAVGDCSTVLAHPREKAGVFAVRQAPALTENLRRRTRGLEARPFIPQRRFLTLLSCGGRHAIASRGGLATEGRWAWRLKDHIDRRFMRLFNDLPDMSKGGTEANEMYCAGCAAKVGPVTLARALDRLDAWRGASDPMLGATASADHNPHAPRVRNLAPRDDAAVLDMGPGPLRLETIDWFPALWPEPYVLGEIAAAHALSDVLAKGGQPDHALAVAGLPRSAPHLAEDDLFQLLAGARAVLDAQGVTLVGGHSGHTDELTAGLFVSGSVARDALLTKSGLRPGDALILTKPLGTGIVFAAWMRRQARAREVAAALTGMAHANADAVRIVLEHGASAATDVTGFGLAGHLLEMLRDSGQRAEIAMSSIPRYPGVDRLARLGIQSSLLPDNMKLMDDLALANDVAPDALALLLDPQTSGGIVAGVPQAAAAACLQALSGAGLTAAIIGRVVPEQTGARLKVALTAASSGASDCASRATTQATDAPSSGT